MPDRTRDQMEEQLYRFGLPYETAIDQRERFAEDRSDVEFGEDKVFPELIDALLEEVPEEIAVLEVGAGTGVITRELVDRAGAVTAMEPSKGLIERLASSEWASSSPTLRAVMGLIEDLPGDVAYDTAVVTFTPRRGVALVHLLRELALRVARRIVFVMDDSSLDWAHLSRSASSHGFDVSMRMVAAQDGRRAVLVSVEVSTWEPRLSAKVEWGDDAKTLDVPYPAPRGTATRLVRYFLAGGDRALTLRTDDEGIDRLYGNLRTAVHRLARDEVTVRRHEGAIQLVRLPGTEETGA
jgi:SAM-dependent methyltransferase